MKNQSKKIQALIKLYDYNLQHLTVIQRQKILLQITEDLDQQDQSIIQYLKSCGGKRKYLNSYLLPQDLKPVLRLKSTLPVFKVILSVFLLGCLILGIGLYFFIDGLLPLYEYNQVDNTISLLGGRAVMESDSNSYFSNRGHAYQLLGINDQSFDHKYSAKISTHEFESIKLNAEVIDFFIKHNPQPFFEFECHSTVEESSNEMQVDQQKMLNINLKGTQQCVVYIPPGRFFALHSNKAALFFKKMTGNFEMKFKQAFITIKKEDLNLYNKLELRKTNEVIHDKNISNGRFTGEIEIEKGDFFIR